tara:strand:+ start:8539 stop:10008 length:1470 start_codon:yes stop_codon:yes gene_type:complete
MSEKKIRILPVQSGNITSSSNLIDINIPANMLVDCNKSYISLSVRINTTDANTVANLPTHSGGEGVYNHGCVIGTNEPLDYNLKSVGLIKNATLVSSNKGMIENIRDVNKLRCSQESWDTSFTEEQGNSFNQIGRVSKYAWGYISETLDKGNKDFGIHASQLDKEIRIPINDIFNICKGNVPLDTNYLGKTSIHLELDAYRLVSDNCYGEDNVFIDAQGYGLVKTDATAGALTSIVLSKLYLQQNAEAELPFFIGQKIEVDSGTLDGVDISGYTRIITAIGLGGNEVLLTLDESLGTVAAAGLVACKITPAEATSTLTILGAEMVLCESSSSNQNGYRYTTYTTEKDSGNGSTSFNRQYEIEPEAINMMVHTSNVSNGLLSSTLPEKTRVTINNEQTTNRDVGVHTSLYYNRFDRWALNNGTVAHKLDFGKSQRQLPNPITNDFNSPNLESWIFEPLPSTVSQKLVELDISASNGIKDLIIFKEVIRQI